MQTDEAHTWSTHPGRRHRDAGAAAAARRRGVVPFPHKVKGVDVDGLSQLRIVTEY
jgi:hypothetical protein